MSTERKKHFCSRQSVGYSAAILISLVPNSGLGSLLGVADYVHDSTVAVVGALLLFALINKTGKPLLTWKGRRPFRGDCMIVGSGYATAKFSETGLAEWIGGQMTFIGDYLPLIALLIVTFIVFLTEINSIPPRQIFFYPVLAVAVAASINPLFLMIPATRLFVRSPS
jgi:sodium-dependent dicarboxylate transporter 2/3/5